MKYVSFPLQAIDTKTRVDLQIFFLQVFFAVCNRFMEDHSTL